MVTNDRQKQGLLAGVSLLLMAVVAGFSFGYVYNGMVLPDQDSQTVENIRNGLGLFRVGALGWILILVLDVIVALTLLRYFKPIHSTLSFMTAGLRLVYTAFLGLAISHLFAVIGRISSAAETSDIMASLHSFEVIWSGSLALFGLHLLGLGILSLRSDIVPRIWGWLLVVAGICYTGVHGAKALLPAMLEQVHQAEMVLSLPMALGELGFAIWLIYACFRTNPSAV
ncbi:MAG: DUF4386 domain-containing protein [Saprospiraceae bacterium]|nr:DUF4386 domain-containing protein [Saprospiraceae bacterium]